MNTANYIVRANLRQVLLSNPPETISDACAWWFKYNEVSPKGTLGQKAGLYGFAKWFFAKLWETETDPETRGLLLKLQLSYEDMWLSARKMQQLQKQIDNML